MVLARNLERDIFIFNLSIVEELLALCQLVCAVQAVSEHFQEYHFIFHLTVGCREGQQSILTQHYFQECIRCKDNKEKLRIIEN